MRWILLFACALSALAQPKVNGVRTLATVGDRSVIAKGSVFEVLGEGLGASNLTADVPYPRDLGGVSILFGTTEAFLVSTSASRLVGIAPASLATGDASVAVRFDGKTSNAVKVRIAATNFGVVTDTGTFGGLAAGPFSWASPIAAGGATIELDATGLGPIADVADNDFAPENNLYPDAVLLIGSVEVPLSYLGRNPARPGFDRIVATLPAEGLPTGCSVPARIRNGDAISLTFTLPFLAPDQTACVHPLGLSPEALSTLANGGSIVRGGFFLLRGIGESLAGGRVFESNTDAFSGGFVRYSAESIALQTAQTLLSGVYDANGCVIYDAVDGQPGTYLDAGDKVQLEDPSWSLAIARGTGLSLNQYNIVLDSIPANPFLPSPKLRFNPGVHKLTGTGGADVGPFSVEIKVSPQLQWTNMAATTEIDSAADLTLNFTGAVADDEITASGLVRGPAPEEPSKIVNRVWTCVARGAAGKIVAPSAMLRKLPKVSAAELANPASGRYSSLSLGQYNPRDHGNFRAPLVAGGETEITGFLFNYTFSKTPVPVR